MYDTAKVVVTKRMVGGPDKGHLRVHTVNFPSVDLANEFMAHVQMAPMGFDNRAPRGLSEVVDMTMVRVKDPLLEY